VLFDIKNQFKQLEKIMAMKKTFELLPLVTAIFLTGQCAWAADSLNPTLPTNITSSDDLTLGYYGFAQLQMNSYNSAGVSSTRLEDGASRFGVALSRVIDGNLTAIMGAATGFTTDSGYVGTTYNATTQAAGTTTLRDAYVGFSSPIGVIAAGRLDDSAPTGTPMYNSIAKVFPSAPNDQGATAYVDTVFLVGNINRQSNSIGFYNNKIENLNLRLRYVSTGIDNGTGPTGENSKNATDFAFDYKLDSLTFTGGYANLTQNSASTTNSLQHKNMIGARWDMPMGFTLSYIGVKDSYNNTSAARGSVNASGLGLSYATGPHKFNINSLNRDIQTNLTQTRHINQYSYTYNLSSKNQIFIYTQNDNMDANGAASTKVNGISYKFWF
jgi:hypothetical protein